MQKELLKRKLKTFYLNSLVQGDKCVIYEDLNLKVGCIRQISLNPQADTLLCSFKIFLRNQSKDN
jgi:hypothetical protein